MTSSTTTPNSLQPTGDIWATAIDLTPNVWRPAQFTTGGANWVESVEAMRMVPINPNDPTLLRFRFKIKENARGSFNPLYIAHEALRGSGQSLTVNTTVITVLIPYVFLDVHTHLQDGMLVDSDENVFAHLKSFDPSFVKAPPIPDETPPTDPPPTNEL